MRPCVVIVGGGYAGVSALKVLASSGLCDVLLIDQRPYHYLQTEAYELVANECSITEVTIDLLALCLSYGEHVRFEKDVIRGIDVGAKCVTGEFSCHPFDYVLLCAGSKTAFHKSVVGLRENAYGLKTLPSALHLKQQFEQRMYERMESEGRWSGEPFTIVIGGGGLSGVETAAEMAYYIREFHHANTMTCDTIRIFLIVPHETVLEGMEPYLIIKATKRLLKLGVKIINHSRITSVEKHTLVLNETDILPFDFMIFAGGIVASTLTQTLGVPKNIKEQLMVDEYLRVPSLEGVFAAGDIAQLCDCHQTILPPTAQTAEQSGMHAAHNILASIEAKPMQKSNLKIEGMMVALGGKYASVSLLGWLRMSGFIGYFIKTIVMKSYHLKLHTQCRKGMRHCFTNK